ncbi:MAG: hypothetical protein ACRDTZ_20830 [Pseudonocardiaceae bacterium]
MENGLGATVRDLATTVRNRNVFDGLALLIALGLVGAGFFIGTIGGGETGGGTSVEFTVTPNDQSRPLPPGSTKTFTLYVNNPKDYGVRVTSISEGSSIATLGGCPAGAVTSAPVENPTGFISAAGYRAYDVSVTMAADAGDKCTGQSFILPLTVELAAPADDR